MKTIALSPAEVAAEPARQEPVKAGPGMKALLAEDIPVDRMLFQKMLIKLGHQVLVAEHGREALTLLRTQSVDLILMDCRMRGGGYAAIPVIALTASALDEDRQRCMAAGMNDFLSKPVILSTLADTLNRWTEIASHRLER